MDQYGDQERYIKRTTLITKMDQLHIAPPPSGLFEVTTSKHHVNKERRKVLVTHKASNVDLPLTPASLP